MKGDKSQISIEYLILIGFVLLVVIVPSVFFLYTLANKGIGTTIKSQKVLDLGNGFVDNAKQIYYLGLYSQKTVEFEVPPNVKNMFIAELFDGSDYFYYVGIYVEDERGEVKSYFLSEVPINSDAANAYVSVTGDPGPIPECAPLGVVCSYYDFVDFAIKEGKKKFKFETLLDGSDIKVTITPLI